jgi:hypothetical protein
VIFINDCPAGDDGLAQAQNHGLDILGTSKYLISCEAFARHSLKAVRTPQPIYILVVGRADAFADSSFQRVH